MQVLTAGASECLTPFGDRDSPVVIKVKHHSAGSWSNTTGALTRRDKDTEKMAVYKDLEETKSADTLILDF